MRAASWVEAGVIANQNLLSYALTLPPVARMDFNFVEEIAW